jgi:hypothetical protein
VTDDYAFELDKLNGNGQEETFGIIWTWLTSTKGP